MCRINFKETFRMNIGLPKRPKKSYLIPSKKKRKTKIYFFRKVRETNIKNF